MEQKLGLGEIWANTSSTDDIPMECWLMAYGFVGAGFPEHYDRIRPIVHPL
jgi:hypothetical protein